MEKIEIGHSVNQHLCLDKWSHEGKGAVYIKWQQAWALVAKNGVIEVGRNVANGDTCGCKLVQNTLKLRNVLCLGSVKDDLLLLCWRTPKAQDCFELLPK